MQALRSGVLLAPETVAMMVAPHATDGVEAAGYGMELAVEGERVTLYGHNGSDPGVAAYVAHFVDRGITVIVLCNYDRGAWAVVQRLLGALGLHDPRG